MQDLKGKKIVIMGIANNRSLAWFIAKRLHEAGARLAFNYLNEKMEKRVRPLAEEFNAEIISECDVTNEEQLTNFFSEIHKKWGSIDGVVHSIAYAEREDLEGRFVDTSRKGFQTALDISAYSLVSVSKQAEALLEKGGSIISLSYLGANRVVPNYNVMGVAKAALEASARYLANDLGEKKIRVNTISAGPIKTLSASGIRDFRTMLSAAEEKTPLKETISGESVGSMAAFLLSDESRHITGDNIFVDCGAHILA